MNGATVDDLNWLTSDVAAPWLALADALADSPLECAARLRRELTASRAALVQEQSRLRLRAVRKFPDAAAMFFTARGLEQATDARIAEYKASRFPVDATIADLCCGIGGDLSALSARGPVVGVDRDVVTAHLAAANLRATCTEPRQIDSRVECSNVAVFNVGDCAAWHIDPDRRPEGKRSTRVSLHEPSNATIDALRRANEHAAVKLAPAAEVPDAWSHEADLEWIGHDRQCQQLVAWFGGLTRSPGTRRATALLDSGAVSFVGKQDLRPGVAPSVGRYLFEPHAAVLAAGLWGDLAARHRLTALAAHIPYLTSDAMAEEPLLAAFEVLEVLPLETRKLKQALAARGVGTLEIKKRGAAIEPETLRRQLKLAGDESLTLIATPFGERSVGVLCRRVRDA